MCGIFGAIRKSQFYPPEAFTRFRELTDMVAYRGPNDSGYVAFKFERNGIADDGQPFNAFLGHRRLSILDLSSAGHQPMTDGKGRWIVFNGEIFNYLELRHDLINQGYRFQTETDTEVILHTYDRFGAAGFEMLNGMWAFAILDLRSRRVVLSRDRFSMKPLYWLERGDDLYFASEIKQLLTFLPKREFNPEVMASYLSQGLLNHTDQTFFSGISKVSAKTTLTACINTGRTFSQKYWDYTSPSYHESRETIDEFHDLFLDSVRIRLRSDVKVGVLLSGGLDSSSIAVMANQLTEGKLESYSVVSREGGCSEEPFIDELCRSHSIKGHKLTFETPDIVQELQRIVYHNDEPFGTFSPIAQFRLLEFIKDRTDVTVLLSGQGGDEAMLGYSKFFFFYLQELARRGDYYQAAIQLLWSILERTVVRQFRLGEARRYIRGLSQQPSRSFVRLRCDPEPIWKCDGLRERQIADMDKYSVPALAHYEDRIPMAHSLELRHPFLDHRLVSFLINLSHDWKIKNGWTKYILRESITSLPDAIRWRRDKQGFIVPEEFWLKHTLADTIEKNFRQSVLGQLGIIDDAQFLQYYQKFRSGKSRIWYTDISRTLIAEAWAQRFLA